MVGPDDTTTAFIRPYPNSQIVDILTKMKQSVSIPVTCKIRLLPSMEKTLGRKEDVTTKCVSSIDWLIGVLASIGMLEPARADLFCFEPNMNSFYFSVSLAFYSCC